MREGAEVLGAGVKPLMDWLGAGLPFGAFLTVAPSLLLALILGGCLGRRLGLVNLFHAGTAMRQFDAGLGVGLVFALNGFVLALLYSGSVAPATIPRFVLGISGAMLALIGVGFYVASLLAARAHERRSKALENNQIYAGAGRADGERPRDTADAGSLDEALAHEVSRFDAERPIARESSWYVGAGVLAATLTIAGLFWLVSAAPRLLTGEPEAAAPGWDTYHWVAATLFALAMLVHFSAGVAAAQRKVPKWVYRTDLILCGALAEAVLVIGALCFHRAHWALLVVAVLLAVAVRAAFPHRYSFGWKHIGGRKILAEGMETPARRGAWSRSDRAALKATGHFPPHRDEEGAEGPQKRSSTQPRPLIIVCASGGGMRAAVWTCQVLAALDEKTGERFSKHVRLVFGASGGMLGAAHYVNWRRSGSKGDGATRERFLAQIEKESLSRLAAHLVLTDVPPWSNLFTGQHRDEAIEQHWADNLEIERNQFTFRSLAEAEQRGEIPSLVFSPMMLEDGRRLLFSNLDLHPLTLARGCELRPRQSAPGDHRLSQSAVQASKLIELPEVEVLNVVRASATFPYVMPISSIDTEPRRQLVDAGYYDNYGTGLAAAWLEATLDDDARREWLLRHDRVLVVQIRDSVLTHTLPLWATGEASPGYWGRFLEQTLGPIRGLLGFQEAVQLFENDEDLAEVLCRINSHAPGKAATVTFDFSGHAALSWFLGDEGLEMLRGAIAGPRVGDRLQSVAQWLGWQRR